MSLSSLPWINYALWSASSTSGRASPIFPHFLIMIFNLPFRFKAPYSPSLNTNLKGFRTIDNFKSIIGCTVYIWVTWGEQPIMGDGDWNLCWKTNKNINEHLSSTVDQTKVFGHNENDFFSIWKRKQKCYSIGNTHKNVC